MSRPGGYLLLEDGAVFPGRKFLGSEPAPGEAVFNTSHTGYQEILTDPSYHGQIIVFTAVYVGGVGVNRSDAESDGVKAAGAVVRNLAAPSNWRSELRLDDYLSGHETPLLVGADTRSLALHLRRQGAMRAGLFPGDFPPREALEIVQNSPSMVGANLVQAVTCSQPYRFECPPEDLVFRKTTDFGQGLRVAVLDCGVKRNILRELAARGCDVYVYPASTSPGEILAGNYHGVVLSNGPGDPAALPELVHTTTQLLGKLPIFGICLGHQILSLAAGLETYKLHFGHRGANHPVLRELDAAVEITSQNHGFAVKPLQVRAPWKVTHVNLNDGTVEGLEHTELPAFSLQYHPEASPGPHDSLSAFDRFVRMMLNA